MTTKQEDQERRETLNGISISELIESISDDALGALLEEATTRESVAETECWRQAEVENLEPTSRALGELAWARAFKETIVIEMAEREDLARALDDD